ncbi:SUMF1/EgtB/PvdO family nonheme iron enzyme [Saccharopolyspora sp. NPDC000359]|uniref:formylglycine-generating enzyme family protein n=1 Tax=Saccharopolyspora sp. NPDC000359 TaxID=3154251 RepID=UPI00331FB018
MTDMITITGGEFTPGAPPDQLDWLQTEGQAFPPEWFADEAAAHAVVLPDYRIDRFPVTVAQFREFVRDTGYRTDAERNGYGLVYTERYWAELEGACWSAPAGPGVDPDERDDHPVVHISWPDAAAYASWAGKRLPTEVEWEFAARGRTGRLWPWGDTWDRTRANTAEFHAGELTSLEQWKGWWQGLHAKGGPVPQTTPVGAFPRGASPSGCQDLAGNVYEWTSSTASSYGGGQECDPTIRSVMGRYRAIRGGSWMNFRYQVRCTERMYGDPDGWSNFALGFRCAMDG